MNIGTALVVCAGLAAAALAINAVENFFLRRWLKRHLKLLNSAKPISDRPMAVQELERARHVAHYAQQRPSWRGPEITQLGQILDYECSRRLDALLR